jgi:hypothetical protein
MADAAKKNPARTVRRVYLAIELWQESGLSQVNTKNIQRNVCQQKDIWHGFQILASGVAASLL